MESKKHEVALIEQEDAADQNFLEYKASDLLEAFGKGNHIPGSGSAAALTSLIAIEMMRTVLQLSKTKESYKDNWAEFEFILQEITEKFKPRLTELFHSDAKEFHKVSFLRRKRDNSNDSKEKEKYTKEALAQLRLATEIPIEVCEISFKLLQYAMPMFKKGYSAVKGDSGVAISNLLSTVSGTLFVTFLNLKSFKKSEWKQVKMNKAVELAKKYTEIQKEAYSMVVEMYNESTNDETPQLKLDL